MTAEGHQAGAEDDVSAAVADLQALLRRYTSPAAVTSDMVSAAARDVR